MESLLRRFKLLPVTTTTTSTGTAPPPPRRRPVFDPQDRFTTSWLLAPYPFALLRLLCASYILGTLLLLLVLDAAWPTVRGPDALVHSFSYFTNLSFYGLGFYFLFAGLHSLSHHAHLLSASPGAATSAVNQTKRGLRRRLRDWHPVLQSLHVLLFSSVVTFPFIVSLVFWTLLYNGVFWPEPVKRWTNISQHALNVGFALAEILLSRASPMAWINLAGVVLVMALYLALVQITYKLQGWWVYTFFNPEKGGVAAVVGYVVGILVLEVLVFWAVRSIVRLRVRLTEGADALERDESGETIDEENDVEMGLMHEFELDDSDDGSDEGHYKIKDQADDEDTIKNGRG
jgi:hypothetical protein